LRQGFDWPQVDSILSLRFRARKRFNWEYVAYGPLIKALRPYGSPSNHAIKCCVSYMRLYYFIAWHDTISSCVSSCVVKLHTLAGLISLRPTGS